MRPAMVVLGVVVAGLGSFAIADADSAREREDTHVNREHTRLRAHFASVIGELRSRDVSGFTSSQQAARAELTTWLAEYRDAGRFPLNDRYADSLTPIFRDARGVTCAMAYLIERSGRRDIVDRVANTRNLAYIAELTATTALVAWLDSVGFDASEAARVQPEYGPPDELVNASLATAAVTFSSASVGLGVLNLIKPNRVTTILGTLTGAVTILLGSDFLVGNTEEPAERDVGTLMQVAGAFSVVTALAGIRRWESKPREAIAIQPPKRQLELVPVLNVAPRDRALIVGIRGRF